MTTALAERPATLPKDQLELVRRTVANGATNDELALFLYDCERRGIHPLDKLLHFTKRGGKYTPVTSIDFMRAQAAMSGEMAGSDDPIFTPNPVREGLDSATVTVYRMTNGQRFPYTATARWAEYCPDNAPMWKRMPHTMLGKCAEALALRKAFPQQLAGLYSREEMDQADVPQGYVVTAPALPEKREKPDAATVGTRGTSSHIPTSVRTSAQPVSAETQAAGIQDRQREGQAPKASDVGFAAGQSDLPSAGETEAGRSSLVAARSDDGPDLGVDLPRGALRILSVGPGVASSKAEITFHCMVGESGQKSLLTYKDQIKALAEQMCQDNEPCFVGLKRSASGNWRIEDLTRIPKNYDVPKGEPIDVKDIAF